MLTLSLFLADLRPNHEVKNPAGSDMLERSLSCLPIDDAQRFALHNEIHTRPSATFKLPALIVYVAVLNAGVSISDEYQHLRQLSGQDGLDLDQMKGNFLQLQSEEFKIIWERHTEFTRYTIVQALPAHAHWGSTLPDLATQVATGMAWLKAIPGKTITCLLYTSDAADD